MRRIKKLVLKTKKTLNPITYTHKCVLSGNVPNNLLLGQLELLLVLISMYSSLHTWEYLWKLMMYFCADQVDRWNFIEGGLTFPRERLPQSLKVVQTRFVF